MIADGTRCSSSAAAGERALAGRSRPGPAGNQGISASFNKFERFGPNFSLSMEKYQPHHGFIIQSTWTRRPNMIEIRRSQERGHAQHGWLDSFHSFSFADYHDPKHMGFGPLRVINEDRVQPGQRLRHARPPRHGDHQLRARRRARAQGLDGQRLGDPAGRRAAHERRHGRARTASSTPRDRDPVHFLQIWIEPGERGIAPSYEEKRFDDAPSAGGCASSPRPTAREGSVTHPPGRAPLRRAARRRRERRVRAAARAGAPTCTWSAATVEVNGQPLGARRRHEARRRRPRSASAKGKRRRSPAVRPRLTTKQGERT